MNKRELERALVNWNTLNAVVAQMSAEEVERAIDMERRGKNRQSYLIRLRRRYAAVAAERAREEVK